jgi:hypothetical protein
VVGAEGKAASRQVQLGQRVGSLRVVESGLTADEFIVVEGIHKVGDGLPVTAKETQIDESSLKEILADVPGAAAASK